MRTRHAVAAGLIGLGVLPAYGTFHFMQIEQVIGAVNGVPTVQAIQLRMRSAGQNIVSLARVRAWDAAGANPVLVKDMTTNVANSQASRRILIASSNFSANTSPPLVPDFFMDNLIPASFLNGGKITFEDDFGTTYWSLAFGAYTGANLGSTVNDADGNFGPAFPGPLPSSTAQALKFTGVASAPSTSNAADYVLNPGMAVFINNANMSGVISPRPGDANLDGAVNSVDFNILVANYGGNGKSWGQADFDANSKVNTLDFNILASQFTAAGALLGSNVPEPAGAVALLAICSFRRRC